MQKKVGYVIALLLMSTPLFAQTKRLWVLQSSGEMVEYDPTTFAPKQHVKLPPEALKSPSNISINRQGQILFASTISLPLSESDATDPHKIWIWNGHTVASIDQGVEHKSEDRGSNQAVTESAPLPYLSADGNHLFWFGNQPRRLQREEVDLSTTVTFQAWRTDVEGKAREEVTSTKLPDCRCPTGSCDESCPSVSVWAPDGGIQNFFLTTQVVAGQTATTYKESTRYQLEGSKWTANILPQPLQRVLDANSSGSVIVEAIPDTGCCGWSNQSNDQTLVLVDGKASTIFDEQATYKNADYDVSFFTSNARLSPDGARVAMTITATTQSNKAIQLSEQGQANPEESQLIRKALPELPAVEVKSLGETARRLAFIPHASLVGWIDDRELLIIENHLLVAYNPGTGARRKSTVKVEDALQVFLR
jgi:dipeptidyl aminopeptidase/acylaminoacyl peptidase